MNQVLNQIICLSNSCLIPFQNLVLLASASKALVLRHVSLDRRAILVDMVKPVLQIANVHVSSTEQARGGLELP
eukprot:CAMPEP_0180565556 /NCGR_PEP_ID=MMETSP1037_2-20121125/5611_1 /TAXON_ID=632150 /ORGANISM="Azadinium spinosum, Strain 3D9" /LENGTH=73 /DNA_ID=CAMNT_0022582539 /DNA_START=627 /DNA_END=848 /DNA_ORIENTATION=-